MSEAQEQKEESQEPEQWIDPAILNTTSDEITYDDQFKILEESMNLTRVNPLLKFRSMKSLFNNIYTGRNPAMNFGVVVDMQTKDPEGVGAGYAELANLSGNEIQKEAAKIYDDVYLLGPFSLWVDGLAMKYNSTSDLEGRLVPKKSQSKSIDLLFKDAQNLTIDQKKYLTSVMLAEEYKSTLPFQGSEQFDVYSLLAVAASAKKPNDFMKDLYKMSDKEFAEVTAKIPELLSGEQRKFSPEVGYAPVTEAQRISTPSIGQ